jgi:hypothetical protein
MIIEVCDRCKTTEKVRTYKVSVVFEENQHYGRGHKQYAVTVLIPDGKHYCDECLKAIFNSFGEKVNV